VLPSMFVLLALSLIYVKFGNLPWIAAMFNGLKPAVIALVVIALHRLAKRALRGPVQSGVAAAAFVCMFFYDASLLLVMLGAVVLGIVLAELTPGFLHRPSAVKAEEDEEGYYISLHSATREPAPLLKPAAKLASIVLLLWLLRLPAFYFFVGDFHFWKSLVLFFTKTAFVTIGGSYTVIPLRSASCGIEAALADEFPDDRRLCIGRDNTRASDHRGGFCWIHGRVQPLP
jgi:chromate transporter